MVAGVVDQIDTDAFNAQLEAWFADYKKMSVDEFNDLVSYMESLELLGDQQYAALEAYMNDFKTRTRKTTSTHGSQPCKMSLTKTPRGIC